MSAASGGAPARISLAALERMDRASFIATFGGVFEHSPWVAEGAWASAPFADGRQLHEAMVRVVREAPHERQLALVRAHPELAGKAAIRGELTEASTSEQAGSGLNRLTEAEDARFRELNERYKERFGFPFVMAVKHGRKGEILDAFAARLGSMPSEELSRAITEIGKIAGYRLDDMIEKGTTADARSART